MKMIKKANDDNKGFSLVEIIVVIAIMVVLIAVLGSSILGYLERSRYAKDIMALDIVETAAGAYVVDLQAGYSEDTEYTLAQLMTEAMDPAKVLETITKEAFVKNDSGGWDFKSQSAAFKNVEAKDVKLYFSKGVVSIKVDSKDDNFVDYIAGLHFTAD